ncbi:DUF3130 family protein [Carnobacterium gallinarum]|uniref:DUF3130 family protein n=1 Tax=Carnobacterium gallinarum TaxID=2749 RepID=UPI000558C2AA|nr:DUF3130 family protein [Carnobacterium gallinarum]
MDEIKNDSQKAIDFASRLTLPSMKPYSVGDTSISDSNGIAVNDSQSVIKQLTNLTKKFEMSTQNDGKNILAMSESYEKTDAEMKKVFSK